jgi:hypothetical protein
MNELETTIREQQKRLKRYDNIDGTGEIVFGCMLLGFALSSALSPLLPSPSGWARFPGMLLTLMLPVYGVLGLGGWAKKVIKRRVTYCRTGFVIPRRDRKPVAMALAYALMGAAVSAALALLLWLGARHAAVGFGRPLTLSLYVAPYIFAARYTTPEHKWKMWFALVMTLIWVSASFVVLTFHAFVLLTLSSFGLLWLASGFLTLCLFIRKTQPLEAEAE